MAGTFLAYIVLMRWVLPAFRCLDLSGRLVPCRVSTGCTQIKPSAKSEFEKRPVRRSDHCSCGMSNAKSDNLRTRAGSNRTPFSLSIASRASSVGLPSK